jgi:hypothetical protein
MRYYISGELVQQHYQEHRSGRPTRRNYCILCYPRPRNNQTTRAFQRFWNWIGARHNTYSYTGYTLDIFKQTQTRRSDWNLDTITEAISSLVTSIRYSEPLTNFVDLCYWIHQLFDVTQSFNREVTRADIIQIQASLDEDPRNTNRSPSPTPINTPPLAQGNMATEDQIKAILNGILGNNGQLLTNLTTALTNQNTTMQQGQERATAKVSDFSGTEAEDPVDWLRNFNRASETNRWAAGQKKGPNSQRVHERYCC